jgi:aspartate/methionine/tyrosine aminotransferase
LGIAPLREAIAGFYASELGVPLDPARVVVTAGASAALLLAMALLVDRDDEVLLTDPGYPCNRQFVRAFEGRPVPVAVGPETAYQLDAAAVVRHWGARTRGVLVATPSNPTGTTVGTAGLAAIGRAVADRGGWLVVDEIYQGLSYEEAPRSVLSVHDEAFVINSFSKFFNMTGWRLGWLVAPERFVRPLESLAQNFYISASTPAQRAALACFSAEGLAIARARRDEFRARRDFLLPALRRLGFRIPVTPPGGFYLYADCSAFSSDSHAFCLEALERTAVAFTPGTDFGEHRAREHVRFAYTNHVDKLAEGVERMRILA